MNEGIANNPDDYKVVTFHNATDFGFTPEMGCMYDGRGINGLKGSPGIDAGEKIVLPYHIGWRLAINLAKRVLNTSPAATVDEKGIPTGVPIWSETKLMELAKSYVTDLYTEAKPVAQTETDKLMAKVEEYKAMVDKLLPKVEEKPVEIAVETPVVPTTPKVYLDKQEVIAELEKRGLKFDRRQTKSNLEKLIV